MFGKLKSFISDLYYSLREPSFIKVCCPYHEEETPGLVIRTTEETFFCFGCCATGWAEPNDDGTWDLIHEDDIYCDHEGNVTYAKRTRVFPGTFYTLELAGNSVIDHC